VNQIRNVLNAPKDQALSLQHLEIDASFLLQTVTDLNLRILESFKLIQKLTSFTELSITVRTVTLDIHLIGKEFTTVSVVQMQSPTALCVREMVHVENVSLIISFLLINQVASLCMMIVWMNRRTM
jgi:hypothetical protein